jgi:hypothetical protein
VEIAGPERLRAAKALSVKIKGSVRETGDSDTVFSDIRQVPPIAKGFRSGILVTVLGRVHPPHPGFLLLALRFRSQWSSPRLDLPRLLEESKPEGGNPNAAWNLPQANPGAHAGGIYRLYHRKNKSDKKVSQAKLAAKNG